MNDTHTKNQTIGLQPPYSSPLAFIRNLSTNMVAEKGSNFRSRQNVTPHSQRLPGSAVEIRGNRKHDRSAGKEYHVCRQKGGSIQTAAEPEIITRHSFLWHIYITSLIDNPLRFKYAFGCRPLVSWMRRRHGRYHRQTASYQASA